MLVTERRAPSLFPGGAVRDARTYDEPMSRPPRPVDAVVRWCATTSVSSDLAAGVLDRLERLIGFDGAFFATTDPATLLYTSALRRNMPVEAGAAFLRTEFGPRDVNQVRDLAHAWSPVGWLDGATRGDRMASRRYREAMRPVRLGDELRVALRVDGLCWGLVCLHRAVGTRGFTPDDAVLLGCLAPHLGEALRRGAVAEQAGADASIEGPGVALIHPDGALESATPAAGRWLAELAALDRPESDGLPTVVRGVVERIRGGITAGADDSALPRARVRTASGRWLVVPASRFPETGRIAVVIEPAAPAVLAPLVVAAYGLSGREAEVVQHLLAGLARKAIAARLRISQHTVDDHVKAIFTKTGVSSAGELRSQVYTGHFARGHPGVEARPGIAHFGR